MRADWRPLLFTCPRNRHSQFPVSQRPGCVARGILPRLRPQSQVWFWLFFQLHSSQIDKTPRGELGKLFFQVVLGPKAIGQASNALVPIFCKSHVRPRAVQRPQRATPQPQRDAPRLQRVVPPWVVLQVQSLREGVSSRPPWPPTTPQMLTTRSSPRLSNRPRCMQQCQRQTASQPIYFPEVFGHFSGTTRILEPARFPAPLPPLKPVLKWRPVHGILPPLQTSPLRPRRRPHLSQPVVSTKTAALVSQVPSDHDGDISSHVPSPIPGQRTSSTLSPDQRTSNTPSTDQRTNSPTTRTTVVPDSQAHPTTVAASAWHLATTAPTPTAPSDHNARGGHDPLKPLKPLELVISYGDPYNPPSPSRGPHFPWPIILGLLLKDSVTKE